MATIKLNRPMQDWRKPMTALVPVTQDYLTASLRVLSQTERNERIEAVVWDMNANATAMCNGELVGVHFQNRN